MLGAKQRLVREDFLHVEPADGFPAGVVGLHKPRRIVEENVLCGLHGRPEGECFVVVMQELLSKRGGGEDDSGAAAEPEVENVPIFLGELVQGFVGKRAEQVHVAYDGPPKAWPRG